jgi:hypothetical protein
LIYTPFIIALQYFTSDQQLFGFDRNPRTFAMSIGVLIPVLLALATLLYILDTIKGIIFWKFVQIFGWKKPRNIVNGESDVLDVQPAIMLDAG